MPTLHSPLRDELQQTRPFPSAADEAVVSIMRTAAIMNRHFGRVVERRGITLQQYNVLRILRGAGGAGLPTLAIRDRMIEEAAGITRLLDKLDGAGFVRRGRSQPDRRQVLCQITASGLALLAELEPDITRANDAILSALDERERRALIDLLGAVRAAMRAGAGDQGSARTGQPPR